MDGHPPLEEVSCNLCSSDRSRPIGHKRGYTIRKCLECGLVYVSPRLPVSVLAREVYGPGYFDASKGYGLEDHFGARSAEQGLKSAHKRLELLERNVDKGRLLDVGCAGGFFMKAARDRGWSPEGVEISGFAAAHARDKFGFKVTVGDFSSIEPLPEAFDFVTMLDVIEHTPDPSRALRNAYTALKPDGHIFIATPNFDSFAARSLGDNWGLLEPEHHLYYFTPKTIEDMLSRCGFKIEMRRFQLIGLNDFLFSAGALQKAGISFGEQQKSFVRKRLRAPRDAIRGALSFLDTNIFAPLFAGERGLIMEILARKRD